MAVGDLVTAARYNNLQSRIRTIMGRGSGNEGYGQDLESGDVLAGSTVTANHMAALYVDMIKARKHQSGSIPNSISQIQIGDTIRDDNGAPYDTLSFKAYEELMLDIEADKFLLAESQASIDPGTTSILSTPWNGTVSHVFTVTFGGYTTPEGSAVTPADHRRHFFNAGGEIRISLNLSGGIEAKSADWRTLLRNMQVIKFNHTQTVSTGTGTPSQIGNFDLSTIEEFNDDGTITVFEKTASGLSGFYSAAYVDNNFKLKVRELNSAQLQFIVELNDDAGGRPNVDENVDGVLTSTVQSYRADSNDVRVPSPGYANDSGF